MTKKTRRVAAKPLEIEVTSLPKRTRKPKKNVLIEFIIDETGSMGGWVNQVISGYNEYVDGQREMRTKGKCLFSLTKFDSSGIKTMCEKVPIQEAPRLDRYNYRPGASTNLFDAVGTRVSRLISDRHLLEDTEVVIVVFTDGQENCSREFKYDDIRTLYKKCESLGWGFVFLGSNQDAWETGRNWGMTNMANTMSFSMNDTVETLATLNYATAAYRSSADAGSLDNASYGFFDPSNVTRGATIIKKKEEKVQ